MNAVRTRAVMPSEYSIGENPLSERHVMVVAAHPDDETLGAGAAIAEARRITLVHVTDGAESLRRAKRKGFATRAMYARARGEELQRAFSSVLTEKSFVALGIRDQRAAFHIADVAKSLRDLFLDHKPDLILTHAFEGGHPDHDATAMAVHLAWRTLEMPVPLYEMTGYNNASGKDVYGVFVPRMDVGTTRVFLSPEAQARKKAMLAAFASQNDTVARFPLSSESFRPAPCYQFTTAPHAGSMYYENHRLPMTWRLWRMLARRAAREFEGRATYPHAWDWFFRRMSVMKNSLPGTKPVMIRGS
jgi:LmbE family N-acetylglucosaminyl deacetylase